MIEKKNVWIVWTADKNCQIVEFSIFERSRKDKRQFRQVFEIAEKQHPQGYKDTGCVLADWDEWTLADLLFKFGFQYSFPNHETKVHVLKSLGRIKEYHADIGRYLKYIGEWDQSYDDQASEEAIRVYDLEQSALDEKLMTFDQAYQSFDDKEDPFPLIQ